MPVRASPDVSKQTQEASAGSSHLVNSFGQPTICSSTKCSAMPVGQIPSRFGAFLTAMGSDLAYT